MSKIENIQHKDGIEWHQAPLPGWLHWCKAQSSAMIDFRTIERCACGATRLDGGSWFNRNQTRRSGGRNK